MMEKRRDIPKGMQDLKSCMQNLRPDLSLTKWAKMLGFHYVTITNKFAEDKFTDNELTQIAKELGAKYEKKLILSDGREIKLN